MIAGNQGAPTQPGLSLFAGQLGPVTTCFLTFCQNILAFHLETVYFSGQTGTGDHLLANFLSKYVYFSFGYSVFFWSDGHR